MSIKLTTRLLVSAAVASACVFATAQPRSEDRIHQGYYFWDFNLQEGQATIFSNGRKGFMEYSTTSMDYSYDFCGVIPFFFTLGVEQTKVLRGTRRVDDGSGGLTTVPLDPRESKAARSSLGFRIRTGNAADLYLLGGVTAFDDGEVDALGDASGEDERSFYEIGFRSRIGPYRNLEMFQVIRDDEEYGVRASVGMRYHSAAGFVLGVEYAEYRETPHQSYLLDPTNTTPAEVFFRDRYDLSLSLRFDL